MCPKSMSLRAMLHLPAHSRFIFFHYGNNISYVRDGCWESYLLRCHFSSPFVFLLLAWNVIKKKFVLLHNSTHHQHSFPILYSPERDKMYINKSMNKKKRLHQPYPFISNHSHQIKSIHSFWKSSNCHASCIFSCDDHACHFTFLMPRGHKLVPFMTLAPLNK